MPKDKGFVGVLRSTETPDRAVKSVNANPEQQPSPTNVHPVKTEVSGKDNNPAATPEPTKPPSGDMDVATIKRIFAKGETVTDIGQIDATAIKWLKRQMRKGEDARAIYEGGFSDGKGADRMGGVKEMTVDEFKAWLENGDQTKPVDKMASVSDSVAKATPQPKTEKIEDFGEVLHGAAKHYAAAYGEKMKVAGEQNTQEVPLSKSWPVPDYQKLIDEGADPWAVSFARAARDEIPPKPRGRYVRGRLANWVKQVESLRKFSEDVMSGEMSRDKVKHGLLVGGRGLEGVGNRVDLYVAVGHEKSLSGVTLSEGRYGVSDGVEHNPPLIIWSVSREAKATAFGNMPFTLAKGTTKEEAIAAFKKNISSIETQPKASKQVRFSVYSCRHRKGFMVGKKIGRTHVDLATFDTKEAAREYLDGNYDELVEKLESYKSIPSERKESNSPRIGNDHRNGQDATAELFGETFGFRGVQFGNYVEGAKRQADLNRAYDALMDMAGVLDIPAKAISLNGSLGLAFGARGKGGKGAAAAHFESDNIVINLTKKEGAGSLAHEWWHATDNYFSRIRKQNHGFLSESPYKTKGRESDADIRQETADAFRAVREAIKSTDMVKRSSELDRRRTKGYWSTTRELTARAFESFMISKLADNGLANDYLANIVDEKVWNVFEIMSGHSDQVKTYPYPTESETKSITEAYEALFSVIETKKTTDGVAMLSRSEPVTILSGKEIGDRAGMRQMQRNARAWYRDNLAGTSTIMKETGWKVQFTVASSKKTTFTNKEDLLKMVPALQEIIAKGTLVASDPYAGNKKDFVAVHKIAATVELDGVLKDVIATVREHKDGHFHYTLSRDNSDGARFKKNIANHPERVEIALKAPDGIGDHADELNLYFAANEINGVDRLSDRNPFSLVTKPDYQSKVSEVKSALIEQLQKIDIANKISVKVAQQITALTPSGITVKANGFHVGNIIGIALDSSSNPQSIMNHEAIHALRDPSLWAWNEYGLFTPSEWKTLARNARADKSRMAWTNKTYADIDYAGRVEEVIADQYMEWADGIIAQPSAVEAVFQKIRDFLNAVANAFSGNGFKSANDVFRDISEEKIGRRQDLVKATDGPYRGIKLSKGDPYTLQSIPVVSEAKQKVLERGWFGDALTQAMSGKMGLLSLVPGRNLFSELGKNLPSTQKYLALKQVMDAVRNEWHAKIDTVAQAWRKLLSKQGEMNKTMMDLMHSSTLAQVDPSKPFDPLLSEWDQKVINIGKGKNPDMFAEAMERKAKDAVRKKAHVDLASQFNGLRSGFKNMFGTVRDTYSELDKEFDKAIVANIEKSMAITLKGYETRHADELKEISDNGISGTEKTEATEKADKKLAGAKARHGWGRRAKIAELRKLFESNKLTGPYFPLARFGRFFVTVRDAKTGKVTSFSRVETAKKQTKLANEFRAKSGNKVEVGTIMDSDLREQVDPNFVAEIEEILSNSNVAKEVMDEVWQKWLESQPDFSLRKNKIHREGTPGFADDAFKAFGHHVFHASHQLARLKFNLDMTQSLEDAKTEVQKTDDPVRSGLILEEMGRRHKFAMNPTGGVIAQSVSSAAFVYYLAISPAAALVNISQTTVIGIPVLGTFYGKGGVVKASKEIGRASRDFASGKGQAANSKRLTSDEKAAMAEAYRRSAVDATQAHDLAGVAESGVKYNQRRTRIMAGISYLFHHAERFNREVTFLAAYRMARDKGLNHEQAIDKGSDLTWKTHFDYQNTSRPRIMQNDVAKVMLTFRNYNVNMLWRLFRDAHQMFKGESAADRREALHQLGGITASMALHAGVRGTPSAFMPRIAAMDFGKRCPMPLQWGT